MSDEKKRPVVTRHSLGSGFVYVQGADLVGYPLAKVLWAILTDAAIVKGTTVPSLNKLAAYSTWKLARIYSAGTNQLAPNVLLSRRSYGNYHAFLLMNRDGHDKNIRLCIDLPQGKWNIHDSLSGIRLKNPEGGYELNSDQLAGSGMEVSVAAGDPAVILVEGVGLR